MAVHLARLSELAAVDHSCFTRAAGRPEYRERRAAVVLAQGAALHYADGRSGVKDFDVWSFTLRCPVIGFQPTGEKRMPTSVSRSSGGSSTSFRRPGLNVKQLGGEVGSVMEAGGLTS